MYPKIYTIISNDPCARKLWGINRTKDYSYIFDFIYYFPLWLISKFYYRFIVVQFGFIKKISYCFKIF